MINPKWDDKETWAVNHIKWYQDKKGIPISKLGIRVINVLHLWEGIHNIENTQKEKIDWSRKNYLTLASGVSLSNYDNSNLTELLVYCTLAGLRLSIKPCNFQYLYLTFSLREEGRNGDLYFGMPHPKKLVDDILEKVKSYDDIEEVKND